MSRLVGIIGAAGSGKTTVATYLRANRGYYPVAYARTVYAMLETLFQHLDVEIAWHDRQWKETPLPGIGKSPRQMLQTLGTEWGRNLVNKDLWVDAASLHMNLLDLEYVDGDGAPTLNFVVEDVRFHNEAQLILQRGGVLLHLIRPDAKPVAAHSSEQADWTGFERHEVLNNGSLDSLFRLVDSTLGLTAAVPEPA